LVGALRRATTAGRRLSLRSPTPSLQRVLDMTGLTAVFPAEDAPATGS
jgi:anti-anti-sigma regulatory factor